MAGSVETRITDPDTGGEKGSKLERFDLLPVGPLEAVARHYGVGAAKYDDHNWRRGYVWSLSFAAMLRHAFAFWRGEDIDAETGSPHLAAVVFHALALLEFGTTHPEKDDRQRTPARLFGEFVDRGECVMHMPDLGPVGMTAADAAHAFIDTSPAARAARIKAQDLAAAQLRAENAAKVRAARDDDPAAIE